MLTESQILAYKQDGFIQVPHFFSPEEIDLLFQVATDESVVNHAFDLNDQTGKKTKLTLWFTAGDDSFGLMSRCKRMVTSVQSLLGEGEVCHFHSKVMQKEPRVGGAWEWHQDYGYWYKNQFLYPDQLVSIMVAFTEANQSNGCLQVIKGSHKLGRVNHGFAGEQVGADMTMVNNALQTMELVYVEIEPGDALFFHSNILHRSAANESDYPRWSIISCYSSQSNLAYNETSTSWKVPLEVVPDSAILEWEAESLSNADFLKKENDPALKDTGWENK
jgi:hypothetical protein